MIEIHRASPADWATIRDLRLAALLEAPGAFAATYDEEAGLSEAEWRQRFDMGARFVARVDGRWVGLAGGWLAEPGVVEVFSVWVAPTARRRGVAHALITAVAQWTQSIGAHRLILWVGEDNEPARRLYERLGFRPTGERKPLPANPSLTEAAMVRELDEHLSAARAW